MGVCTDSHVALRTWMSETETNEWMEFSDQLDNFKKAGVSLMGVCTDSHVALRTWMMSSLKGIKFPIISDRDGDFSRAFGILKVNKDCFGCARALVVLNPEMKMIHVSLNNERTTSKPDQVLKWITDWKEGQKKGKQKSEEEPSSESESKLKNSLNSSNSSNSKDEHTPTKNAMKDKPVSEANKDTESKSKKSYSIRSVFSKKPKSSPNSKSKNKSGEEVTKAAVDKKGETEIKSTNSEKVKEE